jgi:hypothetical protein
MEEPVNYRVDEKGKFFTPHVAKLRLPVTTCIGNWIVEGTVHLKNDNRLKDELNDGETFIAITQARVREIGSDKPVYETEVLIVHKNQIVWVFPREAVAPPVAPAAPDLR